MINGWRQIRCDGQRDGIEKKFEFMRHALDDLIEAH